MNAVAFRLLNAIQKRDLWSRSFRAQILRRMGLSVGRGVKVMANVHFSPGRIVLEDGVFINRDVLIDAIGGVRVGARTHIAPRCMLLTTTHHVGDRERRAGAWVSHPLDIGSAAWIGAGAILLPGSGVGDGVVIGAGAVVIEVAQPDAVYGGVPARRIRDFADAGAR